MKKSLVILLCVLLLFVGSASAASDKTTNGDFENGLDGWTTNIDEYNTATGSITALSSGGLDDSGCVELAGYSGTGGGYVTCSLSQAITSGTITTISYWYKYEATSSFPNNPRFTVYWGGTQVDQVTIYNGNEDWTQRTITISNPEQITGALLFQADLYVTGSEVTQRLARIYIDEVEILSSGTPPVISSITQSPTTGSSDKEPAPARITFTGVVSQGSTPLTYSWDFTNDGTTDATGQTATYTYSQPGTYTCKLTVSNSEGSTSATTTVYVDDPLPQGDFYVSPTAGNAPLDVQFILTAAGSGETYQWWFGDGNEVGGEPDSTAAQPTHRYTEEGVYDVTLIITNSVGSVTLTKNQLITVSPEGTTHTSTGIGSIYSPHSVQMIFTDVFGVPIRGLEVKFSQKSSSGNIDEILNWFGITNPAAITGNQQAVTSEDGSISWLALPQIQYEVSYVWEGKPYSFLIYPHETLYKIRVGQAPKPTEVNVLAELKCTDSEDFEEIMLSLKYFYEETSNVYFWVKCEDELIYSQTFSGNRVSTSATVPNERGVQYIYGYTASLTDGTVKEEFRKVEAKGNPEIPLWDLGIQNYGYGKEWYMYIAFAITLLVASLFYYTSAKQGSVVVALFLGALFLFVGWIPMEYTPLITLAAGLAMIAAANKDGREIGFTSIILILALTGAIIGLINGTNLFGGSYASPTFSMDYSLSTFETATNSTNIVTAGQSILTIIGIMTDMISGALGMLVFAAPMLIQLGMPVELAAVCQVAIYIVVLMWFIHDLLPRLRG